MAEAPSTNAERSPLYLAITIEKEVRGISGGNIPFTFSNTWESVITRAGAIFNFESKSSSISVVTVIKRPL